MHEESKVAGGLDLGWLLSLLDMRYVKKEVSQFSLYLVILNYIPFFQNHACRCATGNGAVAAGNPEIEIKSEWPTPEIKAEAEEMEADHSD